MIHPDDTLVSRRALRHQLIRLRNARVAETQDDRWPLLVLMHPDTLTELMVDGDREEQWTLEYLLDGSTKFMGVPVVTDERLELGVFEIRWPPRYSPPSS